VASMNIVGVTLIAAAIVIPPSTARLLTHEFGTMLVLSALIGSGCGAIGMFLSYHEDISSGSAIVLLAAGFFALVYAGTTLHHALRPAPRLAAELEPAEQWSTAQNP